MAAKLQECQVLQMTSYGPPGCSGYPTAHWKSILCFVEDHSQQVLPSYRDPDENTSDGFVEQLPAEGEDLTLGVTAQG